MSLKAGTFSVQLFSQSEWEIRTWCVDTSGGTIRGCAGGWRGDVQVSGVQRAAPVCSDLINDSRAPWEEKPEVAHEMQTCSSQLVIAWVGCSWCCLENVSTLQGLKTGWFCIMDLRSLLDNWSLKMMIFAQELTGKEGFKERKPMWRCVRWKWISRRSSDWYCKSSWYCGGSNVNMKNAMRNS